MTEGGNNVYVYRDRKLSTFITVPEDNLIGVHSDDHGQSGAVEGSDDGCLFGRHCGHVVDA